MKMFKLFMVLALVCIATPAVAAEIEMEQVVVTATRVEEELKTVPANVTVITQEDIQRSVAESVPELLRSAPGVLVSDIGGNGRKYNVDLRGFGETGSLNTLVLVDGRRLNVADGSGADWTLIPKDRVARIEIVRGGRGSVLYGDNAAGGVINIITKKGTKDLNVSVGGAVGSYDTAKGDLFVSKVIDDWSVALNANYSISDGYRENSDTLSKDLGIDVGYDVTDKFSVSISGGYHDDETGLPGYLKGSDLAAGVTRTSTTDPDNFVYTRDRYAQLGSRYFVNDNSYLDIKASRRDRDANDSLYYTFFGIKNYSSTKAEFDIWSVSPKIVLNENLLGYDSKVVLGFDYERNDLDVFAREEGFFPSESRHELGKKSKGYYAHADVEISEPLSVSLGYRKDKAEYDFKSIDTGITENKKVDEDLYTAGVNYQFMNNASAYLNYSKSFRYPHLDELFSRYWNTVNLGLKTQKSDDYEIGARVNLDSGLKFGVNLFHIETENEIYFNPNSYENENLDGDTVRRGVEFTASKSIFNVLFSGSYTYRKTDIKGGQYDGKDYAFVPKHQASLGAQTKIGEQVLLDIVGTYVGKRRFISDFDNVDGYLDDYVNLTSKVSYLLDKGSVYFAVNNILNEEYSEYGTSPGVAKAYYPSPKINFMVGVNFTF